VPSLEAAEQAGATSCDVEPGRRTVSRVCLVFDVPRRGLIMCVAIESLWSTRSSVLTVCAVRGARSAPARGAVDPLPGLLSSFNSGGIYN
jgi:hypothetical protein